MKGFVSRPIGELSQIIADHDVIHGLPSGNDITVNEVTQHPTEAKEIMYVDLDVDYDKSNLPSGKLWDANLFADDTFLTRQEAEALGFFPSIYS